MSEHAEVDHIERRRRFFAQPLPAGYAEEWQKDLAVPMDATAQARHSMLLFQIAELPLGISTQWVKAVTALLPMCPVPHRHNTAFLGLVAYQGEVIPYCSVARMLGIADEAAGKAARSVVLEERSGERWAFPVDAVLGVTMGTVRPRSSDDTVTSLARDWSEWWFEDDRNRSIEVLRPELLFERLQRATA